MRKIFCFLSLFLAATTVAHATQMCARDDTTVIPLDGIVQGNGGQWNDPNEWIWYANFEYGRIYGAATCLSIQDIRDIEDNQTLTATKSPLVTDEDEIMGRSEYYQGNKTDNNLYERKHCYCKLTHPMSSRWVFRASASAANCASNCASSCAGGALSNVAWRSALFRAVGE